MGDRSRSVRGLTLAVAAFGLTLGLTACGSTQVASTSGAASGIQVGDSGGWKGAHLDTPYVVPDLSLEDTDGKQYSIATASAPLKIVFYGYTNCPDICQIMMSTISSALAKVGAEKAKTSVVFVTTDPARDTGPVLRTYLDRFGSGYVGLTGSLATIEKLGAPMKVFIDKGRKLPSGGYEVDHTTYVFGVVGDKVQVIWTQGTSPADMAADIVKLLKS